jgi:hypothetical protein
MALLAIELAKAESALKNYQQSVQSSKWKDKGFVAWARANYTAEGTLYIKAIAQSVTKMRASKTLAEITKYKNEALHNIRANAAFMNKIYAEYIEGSAEEEEETEEESDKIIEESDFKIPEEAWILGAATMVGLAAYLLSQRMME